MVFQLNVLRAMCSLSSVEVKTFIPIIIQTFMSFNSDMNSLFVAYIELPSDEIFCHNL